MTGVSSRSSHFLPDGMQAIDVRHLGRPSVICCWRVGDSLIDPGPSSCVETLLRGLGDRRPTAILLTHIHLDHAGAVGLLARRWPDVRIYVHERGARHLIDPAKLIASASRLYHDMSERWGDVLPVPAENIEIVSDGRPARGFRVAYTPGHASHHVSYLHDESGVAFVGDMVGVRMPDSPFTVMPTPPPDIDLEQWHASIGRIEQWTPSALALTHFGAFQDAGGLTAQAHASLDRLAEASNELDQAPFTRWMEDQITGSTPAGAVRSAYLQAAPPDLQYLGLNRYWSQRARADARRDVPQ